MAERRFANGALVRVRDLPLKGHMRTPSYVRGRQGRVEGCHGSFPNPEERAYGARTACPPAGSITCAFASRICGPAMAVRPATVSPSTCSNIGWSRSMAHEHDHPPLIRIAPITRPTPGSGARRRFAAC